MPYFNCHLPPLSYTSNPSFQSHFPAPVLFLQFQHQLFVIPQNKFGKREHKAFGLPFKDDIGNFVLIDNFLFQSLVRGFPFIVSIGSVHIEIIDFEICRLPLFVAFPKNQSHESLVINQSN